MYINTHKDNIVIKKKKMASPKEMVRLCKEYREIKKREREIWETKYRPALESLVESTS